jgi:hypothetical protein
VHIWEDLYAVKVFGFETFIYEERFGDPNDKRDGALYKADNWYVLGMTDGNTKQHGNGGLNGGGIGTPSTRRSVPRKLVACRWLDPSNPVPIPSEYTSSWRNETADEKTRSRLLGKRRKEYEGKIFFKLGRTLFVRTTSYLDQFSRRLKTDGHSPDARDYTAQESA